MSEPMRGTLQSGRRYDMNERMAAILAVQRELGTREMDVQGLMDSATERAKQLTQAGGALLEVVEGAEVVARSGLGMLAPVVGRRIDASASASLRLVHGSTVHRSVDATQDPMVDAEFVTRFSIKSLVSVPLPRDRDVAGVLTVAAADSAAFDDLDALTLQFLAGVIVGGIDRWAQYKARHQLVDERTHANKARKLSEERFRILFSHSPVGLAVLGDELEVYEANDALCALTGMTRDELVFRHLGALLQGEDGAHMERPSEDFTARLKRRDGSFAHVQVRLRPLPSAPGETPRVLAILEEPGGVSLARPRSPPHESAPREAAPALAAARVDLAPALARATSAFRAMAARNGERLDVRIAPALPVRGDASLLEYAARSVIENVVRTALPRGSILVQAAVTNGAVVVQIGGTAVAADRIENLFHMGSAGRDGLGLDEAHRIISLHGGKLWRRNTQQGALLGFSLAAATP